MKSKNFIRPAIIVILLLLIPLIGMTISSEVVWDITDFLIMGALLYSFGLFIEIVSIRIKNKNHKLILIFAIVLAFLYVWAKLAVEIFFNLGN